MNDSEKWYLLLTSYFQRKQVERAFIFSIGSCSLDFSNSSFHSYISKQNICFSSCIHKLLLLLSALKYKFYNLKDILKENRTFFQHTQDHFIFHYSLFDFTSNCLSLCLMQFHLFNDPYSFWSYHTVYNFSLLQIKVDFRKFFVCNHDFGKTLLWAALQKYIQRSFLSG